MEYFDLKTLELPETVWRPFAEHHVSVHYAKNQMIYFQDSDADYFYYLKSGRVKTYISSADGGEKALTVYHSGALFGEAAFFGEMPRVSSAVAQTECEIVRIDRAMARTELAQDPNLSMALLKYLARTVQLVSSHVDDMAFLNVSQRVARYLLSLPRSDDGSLDCTQEEIASSVTANRVTVSRILRQMQDRGLLRTGYGSIRLLDVDGITELV